MISKHVNLKWKCLQQLKQTIIHTLNIVRFRDDLLYVFILIEHHHIRMSALTRTTSNNTLNYVCALPLQPKNWVESWSLHLMSIIVIEALPPPSTIDLAKIYNNLPTQITFLLLTIFLNDVQSNRWDSKNNPSFMGRHTAQRVFNICTKFWYCVANLITKFSLEEYNK